MLGGWGRGGVYFFFVFFARVYKFIATPAPLLRDLRGLFVGEELFMSALTMLVATDFLASRVGAHFWVEMETGPKCLLTTLWPVLCKPLANGRMPKAALSFKASAHSVLALSLNEIGAPLFISLFLILVTLFGISFLRVERNFYQFEGRTQVGFQFTQSFVKFVFFLARRVILCCFFIFCFCCFRDIIF